MDNPEDPVEVPAAEAEVLQNTRRGRPRGHTDPWQHRADGEVPVRLDHNRPTWRHQERLVPPAVLRDSTRQCPVRSPPPQDYGRRRPWGGDEVSICVVNAPDPTVLLAAAMSFKEHIDEIKVAAALHRRIYGRPLRVVTLPNGIQVPADAEYAMEARITADRATRGHMWTSPARLTT